MSFCVQGTAEDFKGLMTTVRNVGVEYIPRIYGCTFECTVFIAIKDGRFSGVAVVDGFTS
jgi:hypothetical protein